MIKESCCSSLAAVRSAVQRGTSRIELCERLEVGGVTPSRALIEGALDLAGDIPVNVLIRPRGGNFVYSSDEMQTMLASIGLCRELGVNGVVIGALLPDRKIDKDTTRLLLQAARPLAVTFHRAIDESADYFEALEDVIDLGIERILTSGHAENAWEGRFRLQKAVRQAAGRTVVMPGCGVTPENLPALAVFTQAEEFHGSRL